MQGRIVHAFQALHHGAIHNAVNQIGVKLQDDNNGDKGNIKKRGGYTHNTPFLTDQGREAMRKKFHKITPEVTAAAVKCLMPTQYQFVKLFHQDRAIHARTGERQMMADLSVDVGHIHICGYFGRIFFIVFLPRRKLMVVQPLLKMLPQGFMFGNKLGLLYGTH